VTAITEEAKGDQRFDVIEGLGQAFPAVPELQLAHPRRVQHESALRQQNQLAMRRRVLPTPIVFTYFLHSLDVTSDQVIDEG
jgi:hypothetical protein